MFLHSKGIVSYCREIPNVLMCEYVTGKQRFARVMFVLTYDIFLSEKRSTSIYLWYSKLSNNFFSYLNNTSLERFFFDNNDIISSNTADVLSPLSLHLQEISLKSNRTSNFSSNIIMPNLDVIVLSKNI